MFDCLASLGSGLTPSRLLEDSSPVLPLVVPRDSIEGVGARGRVGLPEGSLVLFVGSKVLEEGVLQVLLSLYCLLPEWSVLESILRRSDRQHGIEEDITPWLEP